MWGAKTETTSMVIGALSHRDLFNIMVIIITKHPAPFLFLFYKISSTGGISNYENLPFSVISFSFGSISSSSHSSPDEQEMHQNTYYPF